MATFLQPAEYNALCDLIRGPNNRGSITAVVNVLLELRNFCRDRSCFPIVEGTPEPQAQAQWAMDRLTDWMETMPSWETLIQSQSSSR